MDDSGLVARARAGDTNAFRCLMLRYQEVAFRAAYLITVDAGEAEDAAQEAFAKAYFALDRFRSGAPFRPWLLRIVTNEALNRRRAAGRQASVLQRAYRDRPPAGQAPSPEAAVLAAEARSAILDALDDLSDDDQIVISYRYLLDMPVDEIATILGRPPRTVRSRIRRALKRLAARVQLDSDPTISDRSEHARV